MSRIISEMLEEVTPVLSKVAESLELAKRASEGAKANFKRAAQEAEEELRPLVAFAKDQIDLFAADLAKLVEGPTDDSGTAGAVTGSAVGSPQPVITGATGSQRTPRKSRGEGKRAALDGASLGGK
jgi:hypothetical protein